MMALVASFLLSTNAPAAELIRSCRAMIPSEARIEGRIILRNRKGIVKSEYGYALERVSGETKLTIDGRPFAVAGDSGKGAATGAPVLDTDVTTEDLSIAYLWWEDVSDDAERTGESIHGQSCRVLDLKRDDRLVKIWVDCKTGALMQAEEHRNGKPIRRLWGTRIKKFGERWMANVMEVETLGSGHRTKITVEKLD